MTVLLSPPIWKDPKLLINNNSQVLQPNLKHILCVVERSSPKSEFDPMLHRVVPSYGLFWDGLFFICRAEGGVLYVDYLHINIFNWIL